MTSNEDFRPEQVDQYPLHMVVGVLPPTAGTAAIAGLLAAGIGEESIDLAQGKSAAQRIEDENDDDSLLGRIFGKSDEIEQREKYVEALQNGEAVIRVQVDSDEQKLLVKDELATHGAYFVNYYGRWTVETLIG
jgi:hypothetical protein